MYVYMYLGSTCMCLGSTCMCLGSTCMYLGSTWLHMHVSVLHMQLHDVSMIQDMDRDKRNLIVYDMVTGTKFLLRAPKTSIRNTWLDRANQLIEAAKQLVSTERSRSSSEPPDLVRPLSSQKSGRGKEREGSKRRLKRPGSSSGVREASMSPSQLSEDTDKKPKKMVSCFALSNSSPP